MKKIAFGTLGCKLNLYETDCLISSFKKANYNIVPINEYADVYVINTCTVTNRSDAKSRRLVFKVKRQNPTALVIFTGCLAQTDSDYCKSIEGVDIVLGNSKKYNVLEVVENYYNDRPLGIDKIVDKPFGYDVAYDTLHTRAFLKVQEGCDYFCTYCKIPYARGNPLSRSFEDVKNNFVNLLELGYKEIVLTGINIAEYNDNGMGFVELLAGLIKIDGEFRINITSVEPNLVNENLLELFYSDKVVHHLHIPLQSGSDNVLSKMGRRYNSTQFISTINKIYSMHPKINVTTDIMVGFPGETEKDFAQTLELITYSKVSHVHTFKYSVRKGTKAETFTTNVDESVKTKRSEQVRVLSKILGMKYKNTLSTTRSRVLIEKIYNNIAIGHSDQYIRTALCTNSTNDTNKILVNSFVNVKFITVEDKGMVGELI